MVSKVQHHEDIGKYLLQSGLCENLMHVGFIATIRAVEKRNVEVVLPCGESRRIWYQIECQLLEPMSFCSVGESASSRHKGNLHGSDFWDVKCKMKLVDFRKNSGQSMRTPFC